MKIRPGQAEKNEKASSLCRLRQSTIAKEMKRCVSLRRNVAEKPRGMRLKFVLSQLLTCTHESKNMFAFFKNLRWLDTVFQGQYLPKFEHKLRRHKQSFGKLPPQ